MLQSMQKNGIEMAFVLDEYGGFLGIVDAIRYTRGNHREVVVEREEPSVVKREDGSFLADGMLDINEAKAMFGLPNRLEGDERDAFHTLAGFIITQLGALRKKEMSSRCTRHDLKSSTWMGRIDQSFSSNRFRVMKPKRFIKHIVHSSEWRFFRLKQRESIHVFNSMRIAHWKEECCVSRRNQRHQSIGRGAIHLDTD